MTKNEPTLASLLDSFATGKAIGMKARKQHIRVGRSPISSEPTLEARAETKLVWAMPCEEEEKMQSILTSERLALVREIAFVAA